MKVIFYKKRLTKHGINRGASLLFLINQRKEKKMDLEKIQAELNRATLPRYIKFVAENNSKTCIDCQRWDGKIFDNNDTNRPLLPLHPNCRCKYKNMPTNTQS